MDVLQPTIKVGGPTLEKMSRILTANALNSVKYHDFSALSGTVAQRREAVANAARAGDTMNVVAPQNLLTNEKERWFTNNSEVSEREELKNTLIQLQVQQSKGEEEEEDQDQEQGDHAQAPGSDNQDLSHVGSDKRSRPGSQNSSDDESGKSLRDPHQKERQKIKDSIDDETIDEGLKNCLFMPRGQRHALCDTLTLDYDVTSSHELVDFLCPDIKENLKKIQGINWNENTLLSVMEGINQLFHPGSPRMGRKLTEALDQIHPDLRRVIQEESDRKHLHIFETSGLHMAYQSDQIANKIFQINRFTDGVHTRYVNLGWQKSFFDLIGMSQTATPSPIYDKILRAVIPDMKQERLMRNGVTNEELFNQAFNRGLSGYRESLGDDPTNLTDAEISSVNYALREQVSEARSRRSGGGEAASTTQQRNAVATWNFPNSNKKTLVKIHEMQMYGRMLTHGIPAIVYLQVANLNLMQLVCVVHFVQQLAQQTSTLSGSTVHDLSELPCDESPNCAPVYNMLTKAGQFEDYLNKLYVVDTGATNGEKAKILELRKDFLQKNTRDILHSMVEAKFIMDNGFHDVFPGIGTLLAEMSIRVSTMARDLRVQIEGKQAAEILHTVVRTVQEHMMRERMRQGVVAERKYVMPANKRFKLDIILDTEFHLRLEARMELVRKSEQREVITDIVNEACEAAELRDMPNLKRKSENTEKQASKKQKEQQHATETAKNELDEMIKSAHSKTIEHVNLKIAGCKWCAYNKIIGGSCSGKHRNALYPKLTSVQLETFNTPQDFINGSE